MYIPVGKLPSDILEKLLKAYTNPENGVIIGPAVGEDATVIEIADRYIIAKTDPITFVTEDIGTYTININANDIAVMGGRPLWFLSTILLPEKTTTPALVDNIFKELSLACKMIGVSFCGGHTEITTGIDRPIVIGMMLGEVEKGDLITSAGAKSGDDIIVTKAIAIEAVTIIAREKAKELADVFSDEFVIRCRHFVSRPGISILKDASIARLHGKIHSMHDPTEGGIATGLYEVAKAADKGLFIEESAVPVLKECEILCDYYGLNPFGLISSGSLLITLRPDDTENVIKELKREGIDAVRIGQVTSKDKGLKMIKDGKIVELPFFKRDEITKIYE
jgi:hydrogenase maturation factor